MNVINTSWPVCVDASLVLRMALGGPYRQEVRAQWGQWIEDEVELIAPPLFGFEVTSTIWQYVFHQRVSPEEGWHIFQDIFEQGIKFEYPSDLHKQAWQVARRFNLHAAYDAHYVALAQHYNCEFWTMDTKVYNALRSELSWVHTIPEQPVS